MIDSETHGEMTARFVEMADVDDRLRAFEGDRIKSGHTKKLRRYVGPRGGFAIELRKLAPVIWIEADMAEASSYVFQNIIKKPDGPKGRNSNLGALFGDKPLVGIKPTNDMDFLAALGAII